MQVNCDGVDAFGRKKRQAPDQNGLSLEGFQEGALREEIMVQSNAILTFERKENQVALPTEGTFSLFLILYMTKIYKILNDFGLIKICCFDRSNF